MQKATRNEREWKNFGRNWKPNPKQRTREKPLFLFKSGYSNKVQLIYLYIYKLLSSNYTNILLQLFFFSFFLYAMGWRAPHRILWKSWPNSAFCIHISKQYPFKKKKKKKKAFSFLLLHHLNNHVMLWVLTLFHSQNKVFFLNS